MNIEVRKFRSEDMAQWILLYDGYLAFYRAAISEDSKAHVWQRLLANESRGFGAFEDEVLLGIAHFHIQISTWAIGGHLYLEDLFVAENFRNKGVARALIRLTR